MPKSNYTFERIFKRLTAPWRAVPDFVIIGTSKGGTTSLFGILSNHPSILPASRKEVQFIGTNYKKGIGWYKSFFPLKMAKGNKLTGEATPYYLYHPLAPKLLHEIAPNAKLIVMLREPVSRAYSHFQMQVRNGHEPLQDFEEAVNLEDKRLEEERQSVKADPSFVSHTHLRYSYLSRGKYGEQLERWLAFYPKSQILVLRSEDFFSNPEENLQKINNFLGIRLYIPEKLNKKNVGKYKSLNPAFKEQLKEYYDKDQKLLKSLFPDFPLWD